MSKKPARSPRTHRGAGLLQDGDWVTIFGALINDANPDSRHLVKRLLARGKHGRQVRLLRLMSQAEPTLDKMSRLLGVSRRTVFRYLSDLAARGVKLEIGEDRTYRMGSISSPLRRLL